MESVLEDHDGPSQSLCIALGILVFGQGINFNKISIDLGFALCMTRLYRPGRLRARYAFGLQGQAKTNGQNADFVKV